MSALSRFETKVKAKQRALEIQAERTNPLDGRGGVPSMGLSQARGGMANLGEYDPEELGKSFGAHLEKLHGSGFLDKFKKGLGSFGKLVGPALKIASVLPPELLGKNVSSAVKVGSILSGLAGFGHGSQHSVSDAEAQAEVSGAGIYEDIQRQKRKMKGKGFLDTLTSGAKQLYDSPAFWDAAIAALPLLNKHAPKTASTLGVVANLVRPRKAPAPRRKMKGRGQVEDQADSESDQSESDKEDMDGGYKSGSYEGLGKPKCIKKARKPMAANDPRRRRAAVVKKIMSEKGMKMIAASSYVKEHKIPY